MQADAVILNPKANAGAAARRWLEVRHSSQGKELGLDRAATFDGSGGDLARDLKMFLRDELLRESRHFVIAGGDGTVNLALSTYLRLCAEDKTLPTDVKFGAVGIGSSNDFQKPFEASPRSRIAGFPCRLGFDRAFAHDVGVLETNPFHGGLFFFVNASMGVTAEANERFNRGGAGLDIIKRSWTNGAITAAALSTFIAYSGQRIRIQLDDEPPAELMLTNLSVIKNRYFSGSYHYDQGPGPDDGILGVRVCIGMGRFQMLAALKALSKGKFSGRRKTDSADAKVVNVRSLDAALVAVETDGEVIQANSCRFSVRPKGVVLCP